MLKHNKLCRICDSSFYASPGHIAKGWGVCCSMNCRSISFKGIGNPRFIDCQVICKNCDKSFQVKPASMRAGKAKIFCSIACRKLHKNATKKCLGCNLEFSIPKSKANLWVHCSRKCQSLTALKNTPNCQCVTCGDNFYRKPSDLSRGGVIGAGTFCSVVCMSRSRGKTRMEDGKYASYLEKIFMALLKSEGIALNVTREFKFHPVRKWRFDFAWEHKKIALEVHGGLWQKGGHTSGKGRIRDMEKINEATILGWRVLEVGKDHIENGDAMRWLKNLLSQ